MIVTFAYDYKLRISSSFKKIFLLKFQLGRILKLVKFYSYPDMLGGKKNPRIGELV